MSKKRNTLNIRLTDDGDSIAVFEVVRGINGRRVKKVGTIPKARTAERSDQLSAIIGKVYEDRNLPRKVNA